MDATETAATRGEALIEREDELAELAELLTRARTGRGRTVLIRGHAGIGKSRLLTELRELAQGSDMRSLSARAGQLERDFPYGCVRQLFDPVLRGAGEKRDELLAGDAALAEHVFDPTSDRPAEAGYGTLHGLYWLTTNLAERGGLLLTLDDAHWADPPSLRYLSFLNQRLDGTPALLAATVRPDESGAEDDLLPSIASLPETHVLNLKPLSVDAVAALVGGALGPDQSRRLAALCHEATGGNPFLVRELLAEIRERGRADPGSIPEMGPAAVAEAVNGRLRRTGPAAPRLALAAAVLGERATLSRVAQLAGVAGDDAASAVDSLAAAAIFDPGPSLGFVHPIVRNAVYSAAGPAERSEWHGRAAELLSAAGEPAEVVSLHLLATEPAGRPEAIARLREAGESARARGALDAAVTFLERALAEPAPPELRPRLLADLGRNAAPLGDARALDWLREAMETGLESDEGIEAARALAIALLFAGGSDEVVEICGRVLDASAVSGRDDAGARQWLVSLAQISPSTRAPSRALAAENLATARAGGRGLTPGLWAAASLEAALTDGTAEEAARFAERAADEGILEASGPESPEPVVAMCAQIAAEDFTGLERLRSGGHAIVRAEGDPRGIAGALALRAWSRYRQGEVGEAIADLDLYPEFPVPTVTDLILAAVRVHALIDVGDLAQAGEMAAGVSSLPIDRALTLYQPFAEAVARLRLAEGDHRGALELARAMERWEGEMGFGSGCWVAWRSQAGLALHGLGAGDDGSELAAAQVALAERFGAPGMLGQALRVQGLLAGEDGGIALLERAVQVLRGGSAAALELARALVDLGAALRRSGRPREAREPLGEGLSLAHRCGAEALENLALDELVASGAKPRRPATTDLDSLTPSELRVAQMAAEGMRNKEIAQALFVTVKTVETHLSRAYGKLGIRSRAQLPAKLTSS